MIYVSYETYDGKPVSIQTSNFKTRISKHICDCRSSKLIRESFTSYQYNASAKRYFTSIILYKIL